jgi:hypothetical protein
MNKLFSSFNFLVFSLILIGLNSKRLCSQNCIDYTDTTKCYRSSKFEKKPIKIGTKTVLADTIDFYDFPLVTDWNGDCMPEVMVT